MWEDVDVSIWRLPKMGIQIPQNHGFQYSDGPMTWMICGTPTFGDPVWGYRTNRKYANLGVSWI